MTAALQKSNDRDLVRAVASANETTSIAFKQMAHLLSLDLTPPALAGAFDTLKDWDDVVSDLIKSARERLLTLLKSDGEKTTDAGTLRLNVDGWALEARPQSTNYDAKRLEALLRAKGLSVDTYMTREVSYSVSPDGVARLLADGVATLDELNTTKPEARFNVMRPKKVS